MSLRSTPRTLGSGPEYSYQGFLVAKSTFRCLSCRTIFQTTKADKPKESLRII